MAVESLMLCVDFHGRNDNVLVCQMLDRAMGHKQEGVLRTLSEQIPAGLLAAYRHNHTHPESDPTRL